VQVKQFYSPAEIARELGVSPSTVLRLVHAGRLPALRVSERIYRIPAASFERYKAGTLEAPFEVAIGPVKPRPRFGDHEPIPDIAPDRETGRAPARARSV
jgi:excisionase family DNA binding protein